jgi:hypothetical protein
MDIKQLITYRKKNGTLNQIMDGIERSAFVDSTADVVGFIKPVLNKLAAEGSGALTSDEAQKDGPKKTEKKQSFCTEFNQMMNNILGLLGFEFSKYLFFIFGVKHIAKRQVETIPHATSYAEMLDIVSKVRNLLTLGDDAEDTIIDEANNTETFTFSRKTINRRKPVKVAEGVQIKTPSIILDDDFDISADTGDYNNGTFSIDDIIENRKDKFFENLIGIIQKLHEANSVISFTNDRVRWYNLLVDMISHINLGTYTINTVNELCMSLGEFNVGYDDSFIKQFEILYKESFADVPYESHLTYKPHQKYVTSVLNLGTCNKHITNFVQYFNKMFDESLKVACQELAADDLLNVAVDYFDINAVGEDVITGTSQ